MKRILNSLDLYLRGPVAVAVAVFAAAFLLYAILGPLPWQHFPNIKRIFAASWLHVAISGGIVASALGTVASVRGFPHSMLSCAIIGSIWPYVPMINFLPPIFGRWLLIYGLTGLVAHAIRRIQGKGISASESPSTVPIPEDPTPDPVTKSPR